MSRYPDLSLLFQVLHSVGIEPKEYKVRHQRPLGTQTGPGLAVVIIIIVIIIIVVLGSHFLYTLGKCHN